jgi:type I restriction enzyme S subunit
MNKKNKIVPKLRFPDFQNDGEWEEKKLIKLGAMIGGLTYSPNDVREKGLLVLRSSNVQNSQIVLDDCVYVNPDIKGANLTQPDDILVCIRNGSKALIGKNAIIPKDIPFATHGAFMSVFRAERPKFVFQLFQTDAYNRQVNADLGATINSINGGNFLKYKFIVPKPQEQQKIADCLSSLDELISANIQKLDALKIHKEGLLQQLFPAKGEAVPKLRFEEFEKDVEWEIRKLSRFIIERNQSANEKIPLFSLTIENGVTPKTERYERSFLVNDEKDAYKLVCSGDFAYNPMNLRFGAIARHSGKEEVALSKYYNIFYCDDTVDSRFCEIYFKSQIMITHYNNVATGTLIEKRRVHFSDFMKFKIYFPTLLEQQKIADCLSSLDKLIKEQSQKTEALKEHKKGLMQGLFPKLNDIVNE